MQGIVDIIVRKGGKVIATRHGHNVWPDIGRQYLAELITDTAGESRRVKYIGFGIGGAQQAMPTLADNPPMSVSYPGNNTYDKAYPHMPLPDGIQTLERPVRITGGTNPYSTAAPTDVWLKQPPVPGFRTIWPAGTTGEVSFRTIVDGTSGGAAEIAYGTFLQVPLSEVGLFLSDADVNDYDNNLVAYFSFVTILFPQEATLELSWKVRFG